MAWEIDFKEAPLSSRLPLHFCRTVLIYARGWQDRYWTTRLSADSLYPLHSTERAADCYQSRVAVW